MTAADFAAAQERVAARRKAREAAAEAHRIRLQSQHSTLQYSRLPASISSIWPFVASQWDVVKGRDGTQPSFRVGQVDAELLDEELLGLLQGQVGEALKFFDPHLRDDWSAEILLALRSILFKLTIWDHDASYGASLQNLRYADSRAVALAAAKPTTWQKSLYGLLSVGGRYAWTKWEDYLLDAEGGYEEPSSQVRLLSRLTSIASATHSVAAFVSFLVFLLNGKYRTILDRVLRLRLAPTTSQVSREISFEYLNRQLVWHAFTEFLLFLLPLVGISRWRKIIARAWRRVKLAVRKTGESDEDDSKVGGELGFLPERTCAICYQDQNPTAAAENEVAAISAASSGVVGSAQTDITNPYEAVPCGCKYCYLCLAQRLEAEEGEPWTCLRCGELVQACQPWNGDVWEDTKRPGSGKSVSFASEGKEELTSLEPIPVDATIESLPEEHKTVTERLYESAEWAQVTRSILDEGVEDETEDEEGTNASNTYDDDEDLSHHQQDDYD